ncbi:cytochrome P450 [Auriculariales sp. MPI-PUGE-AT-0066]|nr:cytochrome P450 [Auriculariales sp. MPI-PUGE-AT-0066]
MYFDWKYRLYVLRGAVRLVVLPPVAWYLLVARPQGIQFTLTHGLGAIALDQGLQWAWESLRTWWAARRLGARRPPEAQGRWPGNLDIMLKMTFSKGKHTAWNAKELLESVNSTTVNVRLLGSDLYITTDERVVKHMLATSFDDFVKGDTQTLRLESFLGNGIFNRDGDLWRMHRTMTRPFFARERISDLHRADTHTNKLIDIIISHCESGPRHGALDIQDLFARLTMDNGSDFLFGQSLGTLDHPRPRADNAQIGVKGNARRCAEFVNAFESMIFVNEDRAKTMIWMALEFFHDRNAKHVKIARNYVDGLITKAISRRGSAETAETERQKVADDETLLDFMIASCEDKTIIRDELLNVMIAARDTTASTLTFATYLLCRHPEVYRKLRDEVFSICGRDRVPNLDELRQMRYLRAVINESMRLFPPISFNMRCPAKADSVVQLSDNGEENNMYIPAGTPVLYIPLLMQRRKDLFGEDADDFDPERWLDPERVARYTKNPFMWIPFNAGPRICLGQQFAYNVGTLVLARLAQRFSKIELAEDVQPAASKPPEAWKQLDGRPAHEKIWPATALTMFVKGGLWVRFEEDQS